MPAPRSRDWGRDDRYDPRIRMRAYWDPKSQGWAYKTTNKRKGTLVATPSGPAKTKKNAMKYAREVSGMYRRQNTALDKKFGYNRLTAPKKKKATTRRRK